MLLFPLGAEASRSAPSWGLDRIDQVDLPLDGTYRGTGDGAGVRIYVVGSGVATSGEFGGRLQAGYGAAGDCQGTGTQAASVAAGSNYGIATAATVVPVRVRDCLGSLGSVSAGLDWIKTNHPSGAQGVVLVEVAAPLSFLVNDSAQALVEAGLPVVAAVGDDGMDACSGSPAYYSGVLAVGSSTSSDTRSSFSRKGSCLDLWAPGEGITAQGLTGAQTASGTHLAAAHAAGVAALLLQRGNPSSGIPGQLLDRALPDRIANPQSPTGDLLFIGDLREGEAVRYSAPAVASPPPVALASTVSWNFSGGTYADGSRSGTWLHNILWDGESWDTETVCVLRNSSGQIQKQTRVAGEGDPEPTSCSLDVSGLPDADYRFGVRKDLVSSTRRLEGAEAQAGIVVDFEGPKVSWTGQPLPLLSRGQDIVFQLQIEDRGEISNISAADFLQRGTASDCIFMPATSSLPAGGGTLQVTATCLGSGTVRPELQALAFQSSGRWGPSLASAGPVATIDRQAPETSWIASPPQAVVGTTLEISFLSSEEGSFECSFQYGEWANCTSPHVLGNLEPGSYNIRVRARDLAGNEDPSPLSHSFSVSASPPPRPANDNFQSALDLQTYQEGTNRNATRQQNEPAHGFGAWRSVWYSWTAPVDGELDLWTQGSRLDTALMVYSGSALGSLQKLRSNDDWQGNSWSRVSVPVRSGQALRIAIAGAWSAEGPFVLRSRFYPGGKLPPQAQIVSMRRLREGVQLELGTKGLGAPHSFQCLRGSTWKSCSSRPVWSGLRRGRTYSLRVRTISDEGLPQKGYSQIRFRF